MRLKRDFRGTRIAGSGLGRLPAHGARGARGLPALLRAFEAIGCRVDEAVPDYPRTLWEQVWLPWRHWLSGGSL